MNWIKTEESLPTSSEVVFAVVISITHGSTVPCYQVYTGMYYPKRKEWWLEGIGFIDEVYCWMNVPEIPKLEI